MNIQSKTKPKIKLSVDDSFEESISTIAVILKQVVEAGRKQGNSEGFIKAALCAMESYALGNIPEKD